MPLRRSPRARTRWHLRAWRRPAPPRTRPALLRPIAANLSAHEIIGGNRRDRLEHFHLLVSDRLAVGPDRRLHGQVAQHLKQMILDDVADGARPVVEGASPLDSEIFGHRD